MNVNYYRFELSKNLRILYEIFRDTSEDLIRWKKDETSWSYLEVLCHLLDEECEDFRLRLQSLWTEPKADFVPIDPVSWPVSRKYLEQDYDSKLDEFISERERSIQFLEELDPRSPNWNNSKEHKQLGILTPGFYLRNWLAHDLLHIRQLTRIRYDFLLSISDTGLEYAGNWK